MAKSTPAKTHKRKQKTSSDTPRRRVRLKTARKKFGTELTKNKEPPEDLEPDGRNSASGTRHDILTVYDSDDDIETTEPSNAPFATTDVEPTKKKQHKTEHNLRPNSQNKTDTTTLVSQADVPIPTSPHLTSSPTAVRDLVSPEDSYKELNEESGNEYAVECELDNCHPLNQSELDQLIKDLAQKYGNDADDSDELDDDMDEEDKNENDMPLSSLCNCKKITYAENANGSDGNVSTLVRVDAACSSMRFGFRINIPARPKTLEQTSQARKKKVTWNNAYDQPPSAAQGDKPTDTAAAGIGRRT